MKMQERSKRESLGSRIGFIFLSAGCAVGLGNVWRFPFIAGRYGGGAFVLIYLVFLGCLAMPVMVMEFSVGRASQRSIVGSFKALQPKGTRWSIFGYIGMAGNYLLMMFYTTITGWMLAYTWFNLTGQLQGLTPEQVGAFFGGLVSNPVTLSFWLFVAVALGFLIGAVGLQKGVERSSKIMMCGLLMLLGLLAVRSVTLPGAENGLAFYLKPDLDRLIQNGVWNTIYAALGQAFFTLSLGQGSMAIFGSYLDKKRSLLGESIIVTSLDTFVALFAGVIIFSACFAYGVEPNAGPGLVFVTLPNMFNNMSYGRLWGTLFFLFMCFAAMTTVVATFELIIANSMENLNWSRKKSSVINFFVVFILSLPCVFGFNIWSDFAPLGEGTIVLDLEDFIVSNNILPLGSIIYLLFCCSRYGWGWDNFIAEANAGKGAKIPSTWRFYFTWLVPAAIAVIFVFGYIEKFF
jgi:NSS family neurotransmitter:Na+ symporter